MKVGILASLICLLSGSAFGAVCEVKYVRTACPGQQATSYKKCDGKKSCVKNKPANTVAECQAAALKSCNNGRLDITKSKIITAKFNGKQIKATDGQLNFCKADRPDFNKCAG